MKNLKISNVLTSILKKADYYLIITGLFSYFLGFAVADFLGIPVNIELGLLGLFLLLSVYITLLFVDAYINKSRSRQDTKPDQMAKLQHNFLLAILAFLFFIIAFLIFLIQRKFQMTLEIWLFLALLFFLSILLVLPKAKKNLDPFSFMIKAFMVSGLIPAISFLFQGYDVNRIIPYFAFPLFFLHAASSLARSFPKYANDLTKNKRSTLVILGWEKGIFFHNVMVLFSFLLLGLGPLFGLAWKILWPALTMGIVGLFQIFQLQKIAQGAKPNWLLLNWTALILYTTTVYMLMFAFFIY